MKQSEYQNPSRLCTLAVLSPSPRLRPFFTFFGAKWRLAPRYPKPVHDTIIEPFAGSAGYSMLYCDRKVILYDADPVICATWDYLINVSESEMLSLPDLGLDQTVDDLFCIPSEARYLIGWWCGRGRAEPGKSLGSSWGSDSQYADRFWGETVRQVIASQLKYIRHWQMFNETYNNVPDIPNATWFVDPPYKSTGKHYRYDSSRIDYRHLGEWCLSRPSSSQLIVCEGVDVLGDPPRWLPFKPFGSTLSNNGYISRESVFIR